VNPIGEIEPALVTLVLSLVRTENGLTLPPSSSSGGVQAINRNTPDKKIRILSEHNAVKTFLADLFWNI
jgi:hypothetical protein